MISAITNAVGLYSNIYPYVNYILLTGLIFFFISLYIKKCQKESLIYLIFGILIFILQFILGDPNQIPKENLLQSQENGKKIDTIIKCIESEKCQNNILTGDKNFEIGNQYLKNNNDFKAEIFFSHARNYYNSTLDNFKLSKDQIKHIVGMITASYFGSGEYEEGLVFLCKQYDSMPKNDYRYRHDAHALIRMLSYRNSFDEAERVIKRLETHYNCKRDDINMIWSAVPLEVMRRLEKSYTEVHSGCFLKEEIDKYKCLRLEDIQFLQSTIEQQPLNSLIDYAFYTLADYQEIIKNKPNSYLYDTALLAQAERLRTKKQYAKSSLIIDKYIEKYPNGPRIKKVYELKFENFIDIGG